MNDNELYLRAAELFPDSVHHQTAWVKSVIYLRTSSRVGWAIDKVVGLKKESSVLRSHFNPDRPAMPPVITHRTLPDDQIVPHSNVLNLRESKS